MCSEAIFHAVAISRLARGHHRHPINLTTAIYRATNVLTSPQMCCHKSCINKTTLRIIGCRVGKYKLQSFNRG